MKLKMSLLKLILKKLKIYRIFLFSCVFLLFAFPKFKRFFYFKLNCQNDYLKKQKFHINFI